MTHRGALVGYARTSTTEQLAGLDGRIGAQKVMADPELQARKSAGLQRAWADPERLERARRKGRETWARTAFARALAALVDGVTSAQIAALGQLIEHAVTLGALSETAAAEISERLGSRSE